MFSVDVYVIMIVFLKDIIDDVLVVRELWEEVFGMGVKFYLFLYNIVISKLSKVRKVESVLDLFMRMKFERIRLFSVIYGVVIVSFVFIFVVFWINKVFKNVCCWVGDVLFVEILFEEMIF